MAGQVSAFLLSSFASIELSSSTIVRALAYGRAKQGTKEKPRQASSKALRNLRLFVTAATRCDINTLPSHVANEKKIKKERSPAPALLRCCHHASPFLRPLPCSNPTLSALILFLSDLNMCLSSVFSSQSLQKLCFFFFSCLLLVCRLALLLRSTATVFARCLMMVRLMPSVSVVRPFGMGNLSERQLCMSEQTAVPAILQCPEEQPGADTDIRKQLDARQALHNPKARSISLLTARIITARERSCNAKKAGRLYSAPRSEHQSDHSSLFKQNRNLRTRAEKGRGRGGEKRPAGAWTSFGE